MIQTSPLQNPHSKHLKNLFKIDIGWYRVTELEGQYPPPGTKSIHTFH